MLLAWTQEGVADTDHEDVDMLNTRMCCSHRSYIMLSTRLYCSTRSWRFHHAEHKALCCSHWSRWYRIDELRSRCPVRSWDQDVCIWSSDQDALRSWDQDAVFDAEIKIPYGAEIMIILSANFWEWFYAAEKRVAVERRSGRHHCTLHGAIWSTPDFVEWWTGWQVVWRLGSGSTWHDRVRGQDAMMRTTSRREEEGMRYG